MKEVGTLTKQVNRVGKETWVFVGRLHDPEVVKYIQHRALEEDLTETQICNRLIKDAVKKILQN